MWTPNARNKIDPLAWHVGFRIDRKLSWKHHTKDLKTSMTKKVKQLRRFKSLPSKILETIYFKGILPNITYGIG